MKRFIAVGLVLIMVMLFSAACGGEQEVSVDPPTAQTSGLRSGAPWSDSDVAIAVADMDGDGDFDIVTAYVNGIKYFENDGTGAFFDRGKIANSGAEWTESGVGVVVQDINNDRVLDIIVASPNGVRIIPNPIPQKKS